jgi:DNA-binding CsgD family transcriptional regulator
MQFAIRLAKSSHRNSTTTMPVAFCAGIESWTRLRNSTATVRVKSGYDFHTRNDKSHGAETRLRAFPRGNSGVRTMLGQSYSASIGDYFGFFSTKEASEPGRVELSCLHQHGWTESVLNILLGRMQRRLPECGIWLATFNPAKGELFKGIQLGEVDPLTPDLCRHLVGDPNALALSGFQLNGMAAAFAENDIPALAGRLSPMKDAKPKFYAVVGVAIEPTFGVMAVAARGSEFGRLQAPDLESLEDIAEAMVATLQMRLQRDRDVITSIGCALDRIDICHLVVDSSLAVVSLNEAAKRLLDAGDHLHQSGGCLRFRDAAAESRFLDHFRSMTAVGRAPHRTIAIPNAEGGEVFTASIAVFRNGEDAILGKPLVAISISQKQRARNISLDQLRKIGLTPAEADLSNGLLKGETVTTYSTRKGIATATARAHLKRAMMRLGVRRQSDLIRVLLERF